jgi:hypothetical protein
VPFRPEVFLIEYSVAADGKNLTPEMGELQGGQLLFLDNVFLHGAEYAEKGLLVIGSNLEFIERPDEIFDQRVEVGGGDTHSFVSSLHILAGVFARAAAGFADLIDELAFERGEAIGIAGHACKETVDALVRGDACDKFVDHGGDREFATEAIVERAGRLCDNGETRKRNTYAKSESCQSGAKIPGFHRTFSFEMQCSTVRTTDFCPVERSTR